LVVWRDSPPNFALASAYSVLLVVLTSIGIFLYARVLRRNGQYATITGKEAATTRLDLGVWRWGWHAEGPVTDLDELPAALKRAAAVVQTGKPALVDVVCWPEPPR
jgi:hypothetical protein